MQGIINEQLRAADELAARAANQSLDALPDDSELGKAAFVAGSVVARALFVCFDVAVGLLVGAQLLSGHEQREAVDLVELVAAEFAKYPRDAQSFDPRTLERVKRFAETHMTEG